MRQCFKKELEDVTIELESHRRISGNYSGYTRYEIEANDNIIAELSERKEKLHELIERTEYEENNS
jgi:protein-arginine kinase activator protein McsA